jgi:hypothetical protein
MGNSRESRTFIVKSGQRLHGRAPLHQNPPGERPAGTEGKQVFQSMMQWGLCLGAWSFSLSDYQSYRCLSRYTRVRGGPLHRHLICLRGGQNDVLVLAAA